MDVQRPTNCLQVGAGGRIVISELQSRLNLPSDRWILDRGGSGNTAYMWFVGPDTINARDIAEIHREATGSLPLKYDTCSEIRTTFFGIDIRHGECWFQVELSPANIDLNLIQTFIDQLDRHMSSLVASAAIQPLARQGDPVADVRKSTGVRGWFKNLLGL